MGTKKTPKQAGTTLSEFLKNPSWTIEKQIPPTQLNEQKNTEDLFEELVIKYQKCIQNSKTNILAISEILNTAKNKLNKEGFLKFCNLPQINLKQTQANKLITIANLKVKSIYIGTKITDITVGIEKMYLLSKFDCVDMQNKLIKLLEKNNYSVRDFRFITNKILKENFCIDDAIRALEENKNNNLKQKQKKISYAKLLEKYEQLQKEIERLKNQKPNL